MRDAHTQENKYCKKYWGQVLNYKKPGTKKGDVLAERGDTLYFGDVDSCTLGTLIHTVHWI